MADGNAQMLDTAVAPMLVPAQLFSASAAFDGTNWLVVWEHQTSRSDIYCARVNQSGQVLDPLGIPVATAPGYQLFPRVEFDGNNYLIAWEDWRGGRYADIYAARVSPAGTVLDYNGFPVSTAQNDQWHPSVGFDGANWLVVWEDFRDGEQFDIWGARVDPQGNVLEPGGRRISPAGVPETGPVLARSGDTLLVCWTTWPQILAEAGIYARRIDNQGNIIDVTPLTIIDRDSVEYAPAVTGGPGGWLVTWIDTRAANDDVYGARVGLDGAVLDPVGIAISTAAGEQRPWSVAFDGTNYVTAWSDRRTGDTSDIYLARITPAGTVLDPAGIAVCTAAGNQEGPVLAAAPAATLIVWDDDRDEQHTRTYAARLGPDGTVLEPNGFAVAVTYNWQDTPAAAYDGTNWLVTWADLREGGWDIRGIRVGPSGYPIDAASFSICSAAGDQVAPDVAFDGLNYLVVWQDHRVPAAPDIYAARVTPTGAVLDPDGFVVCDDGGEQTNPAVAFGNGNHVVVFQDDRRVNDWDNIYAVRVSTGALVLDTIGYPVDTAEHWQVRPRIEFGGTGFLVVWEDHRPGLDGDIYACRLGLDGAVLDTVADGLMVSDAPGDDGRPDVAFDGANYVVVWQSEGGDGTPDIRLGRVQRDGRLLDPGGRFVVVASDSQCAPRIEFDGNNCVVLWRDCGQADAPRLAGARINSAGGLAGTFTLATGTNAEGAPAVCRGGAGVLAVYPAWTELLDGRRYNSWRTWAEVLSASSPVVTPGWSRRTDVTGSLRRVKHGGSLVALGERIFALVGNNTNDFLAYDVLADGWSRLSDMPFAAVGPERRAGRGACATTDGNDVYLMKGHNTQEFWRYEPFSGRWRELPQPGFIKRIKAGTMASDGDGSLYLIPGGSSNEWRVFNLRNQEWRTPRPDTLPALKWKKGSVVVVYENWLYALRGGSKTNELYRLNLSDTAPAWERKADLPVYGSSGRRKKIKDGAAAVCVGDRIHVLKGGNTYEFWCYFTGRDSWVQREDIGQPVGLPLKKVKSGGALAYSPAAGGIYATVGNNTNDFWFYLPGREYLLDGPAAAPLDGVNPGRLTVFPNPARRTAFVRSPASAAGPLRVFDAGGRCVAQVPAGRDGWTVDVAGLTAGVYVLKAEGGNSSNRLIVAH
ncbi:MAG: T9SS type A sorting domain-containing protein [bacterium]